MYILLVIKRDTYILDWQFVSRLYQQSLTIKSSLEEHRQMTRSQLILSVQSQKNVTKNRTDHRKHVEGPQICQINLWNKSFQNMYGMNRQKLTVRPGKSILCQKHLKKRLFLCARTGATWLWKDLDPKQLTPGQLLGAPEHTWYLSRTPRTASV